MGNLYDPFMSVSINRSLILDLNLKFIPPIDDRMGVAWMKGWWGLAKTVCEEWAGQLSPEDNTHS